MPFSIWPSPTSPGASEPANPFSDNHAIGSDNTAVPLREIPRLSTTTQRLNGYRRSNAPDHSTRIIEDINSGNQVCAVCHDAVLPRNNMWHCGKCYHVFHFSCANDWAHQIGRPGFVSGVLYWKCPHCTSDVDERPRIACWCGKRNTSEHRLATVPNSCSGFCNKKSTCPHGNRVFCGKVCHPGPCEHLCPSKCENAAITEPPQTSWGRFKEKLRPGHREELKNVLWATLCFIVTYVVIGTLIVVHIDWNVKPYLYPTFQERFSTTDFIISGLFGIIYMILAVPLLGKYLSCVCRFFDGIWNSNNALVDTARPGRRFCRDFMPVCFFVMLLAVYVLPIIGLAGGPDIVWYNQMKNSCRGYNTRVKMWRNLGYGTDSAYKYDFHSIDWMVEDHSYYLAPTFEPKVNSDDAYQYYYRFTGNTTNGGNLAVDIDYDNGVWRMLQLSGQDKEATWAAVGHSAETLIGSMPRFQQINTTPMLNGTITFTDDGSHLVIPEMWFGIANLGISFDHHEVEPFIRVFNIANWSEDEVIKRMSEAWSNKFDRDVVMRTASFGHGRQRTDMCIREGSFPGEWTQNAESGVSDYLMVPFAVIAATRLRLAETGSSDASKVAKYRRREAE